MWILEYEARLDQRIFPIKRHTVQEQNAFRVYENFHILELEHMISRPRLGSKLELVTQSGAAAAQHP